MLFLNEGNLEIMQVASVTFATFRQGVEAGCSACWPVRGAITK